MANTQYLDVLTRTIQKLNEKELNEFAPNLWNEISTLQCTIQSDIITYITNMLQGSQAIGNALLLLRLFIQQYEEKGYPQNLNYCSHLAHIAGLYIQNNKVLDAEEAIKKAKMKTEYLAKSKEKEIILNAVNLLREKIDKEIGYSEGQTIKASTSSRYRKIQNLLETADHLKDEFQITEAEAVYIEAMELAEKSDETKILMLEINEKLISLYNMGKQYGKSVAKSKKQKNLIKILAPFHEQHQEVELSLAYAYLKQGDYGKAELYAKKSLDLFESMKDGQFKSYYVLGLIKFENKDIAGSLNFATTAFDFCIKSFEMNFISTSENTRHLLSRPLKKIIDLMLSAFLETEAKDEPMIQSIFTRIVAAKNMVNDSMREQTIFAFADKNKETQNLLSQLSFLGSEISSFFLRNIKSPKLSLEKAFSLMRKREILEKKISESLSENYSVPSFSTEDIQRSMEENEVLIEMFDFLYSPQEKGTFSFSRYKTAVFVVTLDTIHLASFLPTALIEKQFKKRVDDIDKRRISSNSHSFHKISLNPSLDDVFKEIISGIHSKETINISPGHKTAMFPYEVIKWKDKEIVEIFEINYVSCGLDLFRKKGSGNSSDPVIFADPNLEMNATVSSSTRPLYGAKSEADAISKILGVNAITGNDATAKALKNVSSPKVLHIATHGYYISENEFTYQGLKDAPSKIRSGLCMAGANALLHGESLPSVYEDIGGGIVTCEEVSSLNLSGTRLVVLSACQSGLGNASFFGEPIGLRRYFFQAGASCLVLSLWPIPDKETKDLMICFYKNLKKGKTVSKALQLAKLNLRKIKPDPHYWAGFICVGDKSAIF